MLKTVKMFWVWNLVRLRHLYCKRSLSFCKRSSSYFTAWTGQCHVVIVVCSGNVGNSDTRSKQRKMTVGFRLLFPLHKHTLHERLKINGHVELLEIIIDQKLESHVVEWNNVATINSINEKLCSLLCCCILLLSNFRVFW